MLLHVAQNIRQSGPMWAHAQWTNERFCGTLGPMVKRRSAPFRNLSLNLLRLSQVHRVKYTSNLRPNITSPPRSPQDDICSLSNDPGWQTWLAKLQEASGNPTPTNTVGTSTIHMATLHHPRKTTQPTISRRHRTLLADNLQALRRHPIMAAEHRTIVSGSSRLRVWTRMLINDPEIEQGLYQAYDRGSDYEAPNARDSTHVIYTHTHEIRHQNPDTSTFRDKRQIGRVRYFMSYQETDQSRHDLAALI
jgi:hypothetical protein